MLKLTMALKEHLQIKVGPYAQDFKAFANEVKLLSDADRVRYAELFGEAGVSIDPASILRAAVTEPAATTL